MPWNDATVEVRRREFVMLAEQQTMPFSHICQRFGMSRKTGWKGRTRYRREGVDGLRDRSRR